MSSKSLRISALSLLFVSSFAVAGHAHSYKEVVTTRPSCPVLCDGWYVGGQAGIDSYQIHQSSFGGDLGEFRLNAVGPLAGVYAGFGRYFYDKYYLAGELYANYSDASTSYSELGILPSLTYTVHVVAHSNYGINILPGFRFTDATRGYFKIGVGWSNLKSKENIGVGTALQTTKTNTSSGWNLGLGLETVLYCNWSIRTEYTHTEYSGFTSGGIYGSKYFPIDNQFTLGVSYHIV